MPSLLVFRSISTDFTPTPTVPSAPSALESKSISNSSKVKLLRFNQRLSRPPTDSLCPINPDNARGFCITAAAGTEFAPPYSWSTVTRRFLLQKSSLHPEGLLRARGVASSGFRPLRNILDCCLP